eukprot:312464_1
MRILLMSCIACLLCRSQSVSVLTTKCDAFNVTLNSTHKMNMSLNGLYKARGINQSILSLTKHIHSQTFNLFISYPSLQIIRITINNNATNISIHSNTVDCIHYPIRKTHEWTNAMMLLSFSSIASDVMKYIHNPTDDSNLIITCVLFALIIILIIVCACCLYSQCRNDSCSCRCCTSDDDPSVPSDIITNDDKEISNEVPHEHKALKATHNMIHETHSNKNDLVNSESIANATEIERKASMTSIGSVGSSLFGVYNPQNEDIHGTTSPHHVGGELSQMTFQSNEAMRGSATNLSAHLDDEKSTFLMETK